jgi:NAD(P)-dependent dehydrogenase (short-subunit alcohol dehydrogenase family)
MDLRLLGKRALVTGGNRGIGKAIARQLAREGVDVAIAARDRTALDASAAEIAKETGRRIVAVRIDTGSKESVDSAVAEAAEALGGLDILVNAAAVPGGISSALHLSDIVDAEALLDIDIKVIGYLRTARAAVPHLLKSGWGRIINIGGLAIHRTGRPVATLRNVGVAAGDQRGRRPSGRHPHGEDLRGRRGAACPGQFHPPADRLVGDRRPGRLPRVAALHRGQRRRHRRRRRKSRHHPLLTPGSDHRTGGEARPYKGRLHPFIL